MEAWAPNPLKAKALPSSSLLPPRKAGTQHSGGNAWLSPRLALDWTLRGGQGSLVAAGGPGETPGRGGVEFSREDWVRLPSHSGQWI